MELQNIVEIPAAIIIAIIGIAYPIIVDKISVIGEKYNSEYISYVFQSTYFQRRILWRSISIFECILYISVLSLVCIVIRFEPIFGINNWFVNNSASLLIFSTSTVLTTSFIIWLKDISLFSGKASSLLKYLKKEHKSKISSTIQKEYALKAINELCIYSIRTQDEHVQETLLEFYYEVFSNQRKNHKNNEPLVYPKDLYDFVLKVCREVTSSDKNRLKGIESRAVSGLWLVGDLWEGASISNETYNRLWINIQIIHNYPEMIKSFWNNSYQYISFSLKPIPLKYENENKDETKKRELERNNFLEFHFVLGGFILYKSEYSTLNYILTYSQSQPPEYPLLPHNTTEIFEWFEFFNNYMWYKKKPLDFSYPFHGLDNLGVSTQVCSWILRYITLLFIRQFTLKTYYTYQEHTSKPNIPSSQNKRRSWKEMLPKFKYLVNELFKDNELIENLGYKYLLSSEFENYLNKYFSDLQNDIDDNLINHVRNAPLDKDKLKALSTESSNIIASKLDEYNDFTFTDLPRNNQKYTIFHLRSTESYFPRIFFLKEEVPVINLDSELASNVSRTIVSDISFFFNAIKNKSYLFEESEFLKAVDKVIETFNFSNVKLLAFGAGYNLKKLLNKSKYESSVKYFEADYNYSNVLYILSDKSMPSMAISEVDNSSNYKVKINDKYKIYLKIEDQDLNNKTQSSQ